VDEAKAARAVRVGIDADKVLHAQNLSCRFTFVKRGNALAYVADEASGFFVSETLHSGKLPTDRLQTHKRERACY
jgi:hypothetical protein